MNIRAFAADLKAGGYGEAEANNLAKKAGGCKEVAGVGALRKHEWVLEGGTRRERPHTERMLLTSGIPATESANNPNTATTYTHDTPVCTRAYRLQAKLGGPIDGGTKQCHAVRNPVYHSQPIAYFADKITGDFAAEVPKQAGEAVDSDFGERAEDGDENEEEGQLSRAHE